MCTATVRVCVFEIESVKHVRSFIPIFRVGTQKNHPNRNHPVSSNKPPDFCLLSLQSSNICQFWVEGQKSFFSLFFVEGEGPLVENEAHTREIWGKNKNRFIFYFRPIVKPLKDLTSFYFSGYLTQVDAIVT